LAKNENIWSPFATLPYNAILSVKIRARRSLARIHEQ
jgi:hypothetical protein